MGKWGCWEGWCAGEIGMGRGGCWRLGDWDSTRTHPQAGAGLSVPAALLAALDLCGVMEFEFSSPRPLIWN